MIFTRIALSHVFLKATRGLQLVGLLEADITNLLSNAIVHNILACKRCPAAGNASHNPVHRQMRPYNPLVMNKGLMLLTSIRFLTLHSLLHSLS
jgi:hypothetical protein